MVGWGNLVFLMLTRGLLLIVDLGPAEAWELLRSADGSGPTPGPLVGICILHNFK